MLQFRDVEKLEIINRRSNGVKRVYEWISP